MPAFLLSNQTDAVGINGKRQVDVQTRWDEKTGLRTGCGVPSQGIDVVEAQIKRRPAIKKVSTAAVKASKNISQQ
jgi:hypothetical protein